MQTVTVIWGHEGKVTILWNWQVITGRNIPNNTSDIIIHDNGQGPCPLIAIAILGARYVMKKESEQTLRYISKQ